ncbi:MAG: peptide chain release factor N(5)-glutamine methyltransferase [Anaerolineae bacterium]|nr:MAG: peptide chain release factor N(5)-glutamine methyltransferase [Anaerolineae bacterium]
MKLHEFLIETAPQWKGVTETSEQDVSVLIAHLLGRSRSWVLSHGESELSAEQLKKLEDHLRLYQQGVPLPYLLGKWEFFGWEFLVTKDTLIPRPETELMVETVLAWLESHPQAKHVLDIGTGTGCVAISIALSCERVSVVASDLSFAALLVAKKNVEKYQLQNRVFLSAANLIPPLARRFEVVCANLPYIPSERLKTLSVYGKEPTLALDGGKDGLALYRSLFAVLPKITHRTSLVTCEMDSEQSAEMVALAQRAFPKANLQVLQDLSGQDRLLKVDIVAE